MSLLGPHGESSDAPEFDARCPANAVVTRVDGYVDAESPGGAVIAGRHELSVYCSALTSTGTAVVLGPPELVRHVQSSWSMASSTPFSVTCPVGEAVMASEGARGDGSTASASAAAAYRPPRGERRRTIARGLGSAPDRAPRRA